MDPTEGNCIAASVPMYQLSSSRIFFRARGRLQVQKVNAKHEVVKVLSYGAHIRVYVQSGRIYGRYEPLAKTLLIDVSRGSRMPRTLSSGDGFFGCVVQFADAADSFDEPPLKLHFGRHVRRGSSAVLHVPVVRAQRAQGLLLSELLGARPMLLRSVRVGR